MPEGSEGKTRLFGYLVTGIISLIVAVGGGWALNYLTEKRSALEYEVVTSDAFSGEKQNIAISTADIRNTGRKELDSIFCKITFSNATISEYKITGIPKSVANVTLGSNAFELNAPFLNPNEALSVQLLLSLPPGQFDKPAIDVRARGVVGKETVKGKGQPQLLTIIIVTAVLAIFTTSIRILPRVRPQMFYTKKHRDDQRDIISYLLGVNGFPEEASFIRNSSRSLTYWAVSDYLAEKWMLTGDEPVIRRGIKFFDDLMDYAFIEDTSLLIVNYNLARMAAAVNDPSKTKSYLEMALKGNHKVILKRINLDPNLSKIYKTA